MAGYRIHVLSYVLFMSLLLGVLCYYAAFRPSMGCLFLGFSVGIFYSILPDIDARRSFVRCIFSLAFLFCCVFFLLYGAVSSGLAALALGFVLVFSRLTRHRGFFHSLPAAFLFSLPLYSIDPCLSLFALFGFLCHLAVDGRLL